MQEEIIEAIEAVLNFHRDISLSDGTIKGYEDSLRAIHSYCERNGIVRFSHSEALKFADIQMTRCDNGLISKRHFRKLRRSAYLLAGCMEGNQLVWERIVYSAKPESADFISVLIEYKDHLSVLIAPSTIKVVISMIKHFLIYLEDNGVSSFERLTANHIKDFMRYVSEKRPNTVADLTWVMRKFIVYLNDMTLSAVNADRYLQRPAPNRKKVLPCFSGKDTDAILSAVDRATALGKRDYAILKLAIETGLRGVDILNLKLTDINWRKCEISIIQNKTGEAIQLPLLSDMGNAVADYILNARPKSDSPHIFLRTVKPHIKLGSSGNGDNILSRCLAKAGIHHKAWDGKTFHAFRRTQGTRLIEAEVPLSDVADLLGHKILDSTKRYISQNEDKMRACCLDISEYSTRKEGLA